MRSLLGWVMLLAAAVGLALLAQFNAGSVVLVLPPWRVDLSLNFFLLLLLLGFIIVYAALRILATTFNFPRRVREYRERQARETSLTALRLALQTYFEGRFARAERYARTAQQAGGYEGLAALLAARCAHRLQQFERRDHWLTKAADDTQVRHARLMTEAELKLESHEFDTALEAIKQLNVSGARHVQALRVEFHLAQQAGFWEEVIRLSQQLEKRKALHIAVLQKARERAYAHLFQRYENDLASLRRLWHSTTTSDRRLPAISLFAAQAFNQSAETELAVDIIEQALAQHWHEGLLSLYAKVGTAASVSRQIQHCESWLNQHPQDAVLLVTLGRLCLRAELWGKARDYLERSVRLAPSRAALLALAQLAERTGDASKAQRLYRDCAQYVESKP